jgi:uncharacterized coiled-coil DUF342 family protein
LTIDPKAIRDEIIELNRELSSLKEQRDKLKSEAQQWMEKRDEIRGQVKELRTEISRLKQQRDETNRKVKDLKIVRDQLIFERKRRLSKVVEFKHKLASFRQISSKAAQNVQGEIQNLDWKIQTSSLTLPQEKQIIDQIAELEKQLAIYKQTQSMWTEIKTLQHQLRNMRTQEKETHQQIAQLAEQSRQIHQTMNKKGADIPQIRALMLQIRTEEEKKKTRRQTELMQELEKKALEKMKSGEKLTWDEFKILTEKGLTGI